MTEDVNSHPDRNAPEKPLSLGDRVRSLRLPDRPAARGGGAPWLPWILCLLLAGSTGYFAWHSLARPDSDEEQKSLAPAAAPKSKESAQGAAGVTVPGLSARPSIPAAGEPDIALESKGYIIPVSLIQVSPKVGGMVPKLYITEGRQVGKGQELARLEDDEYRHDYNRAVALAKAAKARLDELTEYRDKEVSQLKADLDDALTQREHLMTDWKRNHSLKVFNAVATRDYEQAESAFRSMDFRVRRLQLALELLQPGGTRDERIAAARAELDQAAADAAKAKWRLDNTIVKAPIAGIILSKKAEEGNQVNPAAFSNGLSASLCEMADLTNMEVDLAIAERDIAKVFSGQKCQVRAEAYPERIYQGFVSRIMPTADRAKGAVPVRVKIDIPRQEEGQYLRPEMGALVTFFGKKS